MIARHHRDAQPLLVKLANGVGCRVLDRIRHAEESGDPAVNGDKHHGLPWRSRASGFLRQRTGRDAELLHQSAIPERDIVSIDASTHALPGERFKGVGLDGLHASRCSARSRWLRRADASLPRSRPAATSSIRAGSIPFAGVTEVSLGLPTVKACRFCPR